MKIEFIKKVREKGILDRRNRMCKFLEVRRSMVGLYVVWYEFENRVSRGWGW